VNLLISITG